MEINLFIENHILEQKKSEKIKNLNKNVKEEYYNIEGLYSENKGNFNNNHDKYKSDLSIITDGFCS